MDRPAGHQPLFGTERLAQRPNSGRHDETHHPGRPIPLEEVELVERVKAGETEAYEHLVRKYQDRVFNACWRITGHLEDARDLTQEAFLTAFKEIARLRHQSGFYTWVFRIAVNLALSHRRKAQRRRTVSLDQTLGGEGTQAAELARLAGSNPGTDPAKAASDAELQGMVAGALQTLDADHRSVVVLRDIEGFDYREIGEILDLPVGTVKSRLFRARMALRQAILPAQSPER